MIQKHTLLEKIDEAINDTATSEETKKTLKEVKAKLKVANSLSEYTDIIIKLISTVSALAELFSGVG